MGPGRVTSVPAASRPALACAQTIAVRYDQRRERSRHLPYPASCSDASHRWRRFRGSGPRLGTAHRPSGRTPGHRASCGGWCNGVAVKAAPGRPGPAGHMSKGPPKSTERPLRTRRLSAASFAGRAGYRPAAQRVHRTGASCAAPGDTPARGVPSAPARPVSTHRDLARLRDGITMPAKRRRKAAEPPTPPQIRLFHPLPPYPPVDPDGSIVATPGGAPPPGHDRGGAAAEPEDDGTADAS